MIDRAQERGKYAKDHLVRRRRRGPVEERSV